MIYQQVVFDLWRIYFEYLNNSPLSLIFGRGIGANYLSAGGPHNTYVESVYFVGIVVIFFICL